jgi:hypothetical protein
MAFVAFAAFLFAYRNCHSPHHSGAYVLMRMWGRLIAVIGLLFLAQTSSAQSIMERLVTPGPLSSAHAKLEANCAGCHSSFAREAQNGKCLSCHKGIAADVQRSAGFHGKSDARGKPCKVCHSEHHGRGAQLTRFNRNGFNHQLTNYPLVGGHAKATCAGCHGNNTHYRGLNTTCANCHAKKDPHLGRLGKNCQSCHTVFDWKKPLPFDHAKTGFGLVGSHRGLGCLTCHAGQRWKGLAQNCYGCHAKNDVHKGSRGTNCASCHSPSTWKAATFNHARDTGFALVGKHGSVACAGCHGANNAIRSPSRACIGCHAKDDAHKGARGTNCASCHNPSSWKATSFNHNQDTRFPLLGKHAGATCAACHGAGNSIKQPPRSCYGCHQKDDSHKGSNGTDCAKCHNSRDWKVTSFDHDTMTKFPLAGAHRAVECEACHKQPTHVAMPPSTCVGCHADDDPHGGRLGDACTSCHNVDSWKEHVLFDHELSRFPLSGKHATVLCAGCHVDKSFAAKGVTCAACHVDDHHLGSLGKAPSCAKCHNTKGWKTWIFNHDTETTFALTGQHKGLICSACHKKDSEPADVPTTCVSCHSQQDVHHGNFGNDCERCHVTSSFSEIIM